MGAKRVHVGLVTRPCEQCGKDVTRKNSAMREHTFCSGACYHSSDYRQAANAASRGGEKRESRPCLQCGDGVERFVSQFNKRTFCSIACKRANARDRAHTQINSHGYVMVFVGLGYPGAPANSQGQMLEHRKVMQDFLGRPLVGDENVHHINGDRQDNRIENLELWSHSQPRGQRVEDKLAWAREFIALYEGVDVARV